MGSQLLNLKFGVCDILFSLWKSGRGYWVYIRLVEENLFVWCPKVVLHYMEWKAKESLGWDSGFQSEMGSQVGYTEVEHTSYQNFKDCSPPAQDLTN